MNQIEIFNSPEFGSIRTLEQNGKVLFCGTDVATALGYTNPRKAVRDHTRGGTKCSIGVQTGKKAEKVLSQLGVPMSTAIDMYLNQISLTGGIPFSVSLPKAPVSIHADAMTTEEIHQKLEKGYNDIAAGRVQNAAEAFAKFRENH